MTYEPMGFVLTSALVGKGVEMTSAGVNYLIRRNEELKARKKMATNASEAQALQRIIENNERKIRELQAQTKKNLDKKTTQNVLTLAAAGGAALIGILALTN